MRINSNTFSYNKDSDIYAGMETPIIDLANISKISNVESVNIHISKETGRVLCSFKYAEDSTNAPVINPTDPASAVTDLMKQKNITPANPQEVQKVVKDFQNAAQNITPQQLTENKDPNDQGVVKTIQNALSNPTNLEDNKTQDNNNQQSQQNTMTTMTS